MRNQAGDGMMDRGIFCLAHPKVSRTEETMRHFRKLISPPVFEDKEKNRIGHYVHWLSVSLIAGAILLGLVNAIAGHPLTLPIGLAVSLILAGGLYLLHKGFVSAASLIALAAIWLGATMALWVGSGIHDIAILLYPILIVVASFLLQRRGTFFMSLMVSLSAGMIVAGELYGLVNAPKTVSTDIADWVTITLIILIGAITIGYMSDTLVKAVRQARESELAYAESNQKLALQAELLAESEERWRTLNKISLSVTTLQDLDTTLNLIQEQLQKAIKMDALRVALYDPDTDMLTFPLTYDSGQRWNTPSAPMDPNTINGKVIQTGQSLLVNRTLQEIAEQKGNTGQRAGNVNRVSASMMLAPMQISGQRIGIVSAHSYEHNAYDESDLSLLEGAALQIGIAIQNARLYENIRKRAEQLTALNQIGRGISNLGRLDQALRITLEQMQKILNLDVFYIGLYHAQNNTLSFPLMYDSGKLWDEPDTIVDSGGWVENLLRTRQPFLLNRTREQIETEQNLRGVGDIARQSASIMMAPMEIDIRFLGIVSVQSYTLNAYTQEHLLLLGNAANQIAIAIENARLYDKAQHRAEVMTVLYRLGNAVTSNLQIDGVMSELYESCRTLLPLNAFYIATYDKDTDIIAHPIFIDQGKRMSVGPRAMKDKPGLSGHIVTHKQTVYIPDVLDKAALAKYQILHIGGDPTRSYLGVPLLYKDESIGVISVQSDQPDAYTPEHVSLLETISTQAAIALVNARLYEDLQKELSERQQAEEEVRALNAELEKRVQQRTEELQSFTYTVSHDLRAPLRSINGYSRIFLEDYSANIPPEGRKLLERIGNSAHLMGTLIDDLLTFSRLSRASLNKTNIDLGSLAGDILHLLTEHQDPGRIRFVVGRLPTAHADFNLMRQALTNLLANALKFSRHRPNPEIEVGSRTQNGETVYFIKDNGAGFNMEHAAKLFGVFQRLHRQDEFEGTGVGLAIVQRIIQYHGGRIWAEAEPDKGATFYFTLETPPDVINYAA